MRQIAFRMRTWIPVLTTVASYFVLVWVLMLSDVGATAELMNEKKFDLTNNYSSTRYLATQIPCCGKGVQTVCDSS